MIRIYEYNDKWESFLHNLGMGLMFLLVCIGLAILSYMLILANAMNKLI